MPRFCVYFVRNADNLGICDRLAFCLCEVGALVESLNETSECLLHILAGAYLLVVLQHVRVGDAGIIIVEVSNQLKVCLHGIYYLCVI